MSSKQEMTKTTQLERTPKFERRKARRAFLKRTLIAITLAAVIVPSAIGGATTRPWPATQGGVIGITGPLKSRKVVKRSHTKTKNGERFELTLELVGANDVRTVTKAYSTKVEVGDEYDLTVSINTQYFRSLDAKAVTSSSRFVSVHGKKGDILGDYRN
jgi:hypothetical protein